MDSVGNQATISESQVSDSLPLPKRQRTLAELPAETTQKVDNNVVSGEAGFHQGASFGLNFVTFAEYSGLRSEHEKLQAQLQSLKKFVQENVSQNLTTQVGMLKEENRRLKEEVNELKQYLTGKDVTPRSYTDGVLGADEGRLSSMERQLSQLRSSFNKLPPVPTAETLKYLSEFVGFFSSQNCTEVSTQNSNQSFEPTFTPVKLGVTDPMTPKKTMTPGVLPPAQGITSLASIPESGPSPEDVPRPCADDAMGWKPDLQLTPSQPAPEESPYSLKVQLLPKYNIWVNRSKLTTLLQDSMVQTDNSALFLLRKLIPMVFSWQELAFSRGQGITTKSKDEYKAPLDPVKINACKDFMRLFCSQNNLVEPPDTAINTQFTHTITYARTKMKRHLGKPNCKVSTLMSDYPNQSPIKNEDGLHFAEETDLDLSHFESSPDTRASDKDGEANLQSEYFSQS